MQIPRLALCTKDTARHDHEKGTEGFMPDIGTDGFFHWSPGAQNHGIPGFLMSPGRWGHWKKW